MAGGATIGVDLMVIAALETLVPEKVDCGILDARDVFLRLDVLKAVSLVPPRREDIERNLPANSVTREELENIPEKGSDYLLT